MEGLFFLPGVGGVRCQLLPEQWSVLESEGLCSAWASQQEGVRLP